MPKPQPVTAFGKSYKTLSACAKAHGLQLTTLRARMELQHMSLEEALTAPKRSGGRYRGRPNTVYIEDAPWHATEREWTGSDGALTAYGRRLFLSHG